MDIDAFLKAAAGEAALTVYRNVRVTSGAVHKELQRSVPIGLTHFLSLPAKTVRKAFEYRHILGAPALIGEIEDWKRRHPAHPVPRDLQEFLTHVDGIHLWADTATGRAYAGIAPLSEWEMARVKFYGACSDRSLLDDRYLAISYALDNSALVVLDVRTGTYYLMDAAGPDESCPIAKNLGELLSWVWESRIAPIQ